MADYKVSLGAEVRTGEIDKQLKNYNGNVNVKVNPDSITSGIDSALRGYSAAPIEVKSTLNTQGITDKLKSFSEKKNRTHIKVEVDPDLTGVGTTLEGYSTSSNAKALSVKVDINWAGVKGQIQTPSEDIGKLQLDAQLNKGAIGTAIRDFNEEINAAESKVKIKVKVDPDLKSINSKIKDYQANIKPLKITPDLKKSEIDKQISAYNNRKNKRNIQLKAKLADGTIDDAITKYVSKEMVPVTVKFTVGSTESIDKKIASYQTNGVDVPVRLIPAQKDFTAKVKNTPVNVTAQIDPVEIQKDVEAAVGGYTPTAKMPINIRLTQPKDINEQVRALTKPTETIEVNAKLNTQSLNDDIGIFQPTAVLGVNSHLIMSDIDDQIRSYTPSVPVNVNVLFNDGSIDEKTGLKKMQDPIQVNVHLNNEDINKQIDGFTPTSKVKVGVQLDFATHKDKDTKEVLQKGVVQQIKEYETATKVKVGVELDKESVDATVQNFKTDVPIKLDVDLNTEPAEKRIEELKAEFKKFGNININFVGADNNGATSEAAATASAGVGSSAGKASNVAQQFREVDITINNTTDAVENLNKALSDVGFNSGSIDAITKDFEELGISVRNITSKLNDDGSVTLTVKGIDQLERAVKVMRSVDEKGNVTNLGTTISQDFKDTENAFKRLKSIGKEISQLDIKIAGLDARKDSAEIDKLTEKLNRLEAEYNELFNLAEGKLTSSQIDELIRDIVDGSEKLDILKAKLKDARNEAANQIRIKFNAGDFNVLSRLNSEAKQLSGTYPELEAKIKEVESAITEMEAAIGTGDEIADIEKLISAYERYKQAIKSCNSELRNAQKLDDAAAAEKKLEDDKGLLQSKIDAWLTKNSAAAVRFGDRLREIKIEAQSADRVKLDSLQSEFKQIDNLATAAGLKMRTFGDRIKDQFQKYKSYFSVASLFMWGGQALRSMFEQVKLIDSAMTELKKVTNETDSSYNQFLSNAASRAKALGTTIDGLVNSTAEFAKLGYDFKESQGLAEVANIYAVVGDEIESVEDATQSLVSTLAAFKHEMNDMTDSDFAMSIVDKFNEVANRYSISSGGLGEALQRSASSMAAANNTLDETIAMITAANEVAQNPEKVGNAMKTMSMRIRGAKTELEEAGESTDGMAESTATLREEMLALSGVDIMLNENTFKSTYQIMDELSKKWDSLSDIAQATIIELVAGKHQGNVFSSLMANFDTARDALETAVNSSGSAMTEHEKWSQSLEARLNKLKSSWQSLAQSFMSSDFLKGAIDVAIKLIDILDKIIDKVGVIPLVLTAFSGFNIVKTIVKGGGLSEFSDILELLIKSFPSVSNGIGNLVSGLRKVSFAAGGAGSALSGFISLIALHPYIAAAAVAVTALTAAFAYQKKKAEDLAKAVDETVSSYKEHHNELKKMKSDYDTSKEDSMISRYEKLSKGVGEVGENVSLTADEYSEYQDIVGTIAEQIPRLIVGYNEQGNAILSCKGNVEALTEAYENLIHAQNQEVLTNSGKIEDDFANTLNKQSGTHWWSNNHGFWKAFDLLQLADYELKNDTASILKDLVSDKEASQKEAILNSLRNQSSNTYSAAEIRTALKGANIDVKWYEDVYDVLEETLQTNPQKIKGIVDNYYSQFAEDVEQQKTVASAKLSEAFDVSSVISGLDYSNISKDLQSIAYKTINSLDYDFFSTLSKSGKSVEEWTTEMLNQLNSIEKSDMLEIEAGFDLRTKFNGGEISYGDYINGLQDVNLLIERLGLNPEVASQIRLNLGFDKKGEEWVIKGYDNLLSRLTSQEFGIEMEVDKAKALLADLTSSEYDVVVDLAVNDTALFSKIKDDVNLLREYIERETRINDALNFKADISVDTEALDAFNTALSESASAAGLTSESIDALKSRYKELDSFDAAALFEATTNGIKVNQKEASRLEKEYKNLTKSKVKEHLETLVDAYNENVKAIDECSNASERARLISENQAYKSRIEELAQYQAQLEGVTGAYQRWIDAQNTPEDYEGYKAAAEGWKTVEDELSRKILGNASKKYIDLLSGKDLQGADFDSYIEAWNALDDKVTSTGLSIKDFFSLDKDGNLTATGINNFFKSVEEQYNGLIYKQNEAGEWFYDFSSDNLKQIQEDWGIGIEAIGLILEAATAAGYDVNWGGILSGIDLDTAGFETLIELAETAQNKFNELSDVGNVDFNFKTTNIEDATSELEKAKSVYQDLITDDDGNVNLHADGADELRTILSVLILQKEELERPAIMDVKVESSVAESNIGKVTTLVQNLQNNLWKLEQSEYDLNINSDDVQADIVNIAKQLTELQKSDPYIYAKLGLYPEEQSKLKAAIESILASPNVTISEENLGVIQSAIQSIDATVVADVLTEEATGTGTVMMSPDKTDFGDIFEGTGIAEMSPNKTNFGNVFKGTGTVYLTPINIGEASGTANAGGTAAGRAFARGNWGIKGSGTALGGELGQELVVRDGKFFTIGDTGAEFFDYKPNDIIFNAAQTESLFKYGGIKGAKPRGTMLAGGTAFANGKDAADVTYKSGWTLSDFVSSVKNKVVETYNAVKDYITDNKKSSSTASVDTTTSASASASKSNAVADVNINVTASKSDSIDNVEVKPSGGGKGGGNGGGGSSKKAEDDYKEKIDWIETAIDRIERAIDNLDLKATSVYRAWSERNAALADEIEKVREEIDLQQRAYERYVQEAESVGLSESYAEKVRNGTIDIETITDEDLKKKIDEYKQWYDKALDTQKAIEELKETEAELYVQRLENAATKYEGILGVIEHEKNMLEEYINQSESQAWLVSGEYYKALADNERENVAELEAQKAEMLNAFNEAMDSGTIAEGSEAYYEMVASIDEVTLAITESHTVLLEYEQTLQQLDWEVFDLLQDKISSVTEETEFLIELLSSDKLFDDRGQLTDSGIATMGQHGVAYNAYMRQADQAAAEAARIKAELEKDPYDTELEERYREMISLQQEYILSAQGEKEAIRDLVEEGIGLELDALQELIDKKNEALESEKDLYEYQKKVKEQTEEIASLEKQMAAYAGDDSEEAKQKIQKIKVDLESARQDLEETEYDKFIDDSASMLDELYLEYETILNTRLDNIDALLEDMIEEINLNAVDISDTLSEKADSVGYTLSDSMAEIWDKNTVSTQNVITTYSDKFITAQTTTNNALDSINIKLQDMLNKLNEKATENAKSVSTSSAAKSTATKSTTTTTTTTKQSTSGGDGTPKIGDKVKFVDGQYYYDSYGMRPLGSQKQGQYVYITNINKKSGATHPYHISTGTKLGSGDLGWLKLSQISGYAAGKKNFSNNEIAWTQEGATEFIVRPSDGAILTPIAKRDSVLTSAASNNIWNMANSPAEFIRDNLNLGSASVPNNSNVHNNYTQHLEKVVISFPNVKNYDEMLSAMRDDKSFEKLVHSMTIDRIAGKSSLAKGKSIR